MLSCFHLIPERNGRTDRRTDRSAISISRVSMLTREKKTRKVTLSSSQYCEWLIAPRTPFSLCCNGKRHNSYHRSYGHPTVRIWIPSTIASGAGCRRTFTGRRFATLTSWSRGSLTLGTVFLRASSTKPLTSDKHGYVHVCKGTCKGTYVQRDVTSLRTPTVITTQLTLLLKPLTLLTGRQRSPCY